MGTPTLFRLLNSQFGIRESIRVKNQKKLKKTKNSKKEAKKGNSLALGYKDGKVIKMSFDEIFNVKKVFRKDLLEILKTVSI